MAKVWSIFLSAVSGDSSKFAHIIYLFIALINIFSLQTVERKSQILKTRNPYTKEREPERENNFKSLKCQFTRNLIYQITAVFGKGYLQRNY